MREFRMSKGDKEHYTSLSEMAKAWGIKEPKKKRTSDETKLKNDRERFLRSCPVCKQTLTWVGDNVVACKNDVCKGFQRETEDEDGNKKFEYFPVYRLLDDRGCEIAHNLFDEN